MSDDRDLEAVPDASMLALFKSLVGFLSAEADGRGWTDVTDSLRRVEAVLEVRSSSGPRQPRAA